MTKATQRAFQKDGSYNHIFTNGTQVTVPAVLTEEEISQKSVAKYYDDLFNDVFCEKKMAVVGFKSSPESYEVLYAVYNYTVGTGRQWNSKKWRFVNIVYGDFESLNESIISDYGVAARYYYRDNSSYYTSIEDIDFDARYTGKILRDAVKRGCDANGIVGDTDCIAYIYATLLDFVQYTRAWGHKFDGTYEFLYGANARGQMNSYHNNHPEIDFHGKRYILVAMVSSKGCVISQGYVQKDKAYSSEVGNRYVAALRAQSTPLEA